MGETDSDRAGQELRERVVACPSCRRRSRADGLRYGEAMTFARFYVWALDVDQELWDPRFRSLLESIVGPCDEYWEWST